MLKSMQCGVKGGEGGCVRFMFVGLIGGNRGAAMFMGELIAMRFASLFHLVEWKMPPKRRRRW